MGKCSSVIWKIDKSTLQNIVDKSHSYKEVLEHFGFSSNNLATLRRRLKVDDINYVHLTKHNLNVLSTHQKQIPLVDILVKNSSYNRHLLKKRLINDGLLIYKCYNRKCELVDWLGLPISLQLDHINGINDDNRLENLRLLCPNCHSQTENFSGKNTSLRKTRNNCVDCGKVIGKKSNRCRRCSLKIINSQEKPHKVDWPSKTELQSLLETHTWTAIGKMFGVSDNAVRKWAKHYKLDV